MRNRLLWLAAAVALLGGVVVLTRWGVRREARWLAEETAVAVAGYLSLTTAPDPGGRALDPVRLLSNAARVYEAQEWHTPVAVYRGFAGLYRSHEVLPRNLATATYEQLRRRDIAMVERDVAVAPLKDADDWDVIGAVAVPVEPPPWWTDVLRGGLAAALVAMLGVVWPRSSRLVLLLAGATALVLVASGYAAVREAARAATDVRLHRVRHLVEWAARTPERPPVRALTRIARGNRLEETERLAAEPARETVDGLPAATVIASRPRRPPIRIAAVPRERTLGWLLAILLALGGGAVGIAALGRAAEHPAVHPLARRRTAIAWSFLLPGMAHLVLFSAVPIVFAAWLSLHRWGLLEAVKPFVGLTNYAELAGDGLVWRSLFNTAVYSLYVPVTAAAALALALVLERGGLGVMALRTVLFLPYVSSVVAVAIVWQWMYHPEVGLFNYALSFLGLGPVDWLGNPRTALVALMILAGWVHLGYQTIIFVAGLQGIPSPYLDAARVDGAGPWQRLRYVVLPLLKPVTLFVLVTGIIGSFQVFTFVYVMTEGAPLHATDVVVYRIYQLAWEFLDFGSASALSIVLTLILLGATWLQFRLLGRRVEYG